MHICLTHMRHARTGGTERFLNHLTQYLCERGHEVTIVCRSREDTPHPLARFVLLRGFAPGQALRRWTFARAVQRHIRDHHYDVVLGLGKTWSQDVIRLGGGTHRTFLEAMAEGDVRRIGLSDRVALEIERRALMPGAYRRVIVNAGMVKRDIVARYGVDPDRVEVIYNGVDLSRFNPRHKTGQGAGIRSAAGFAPQHVVYLFLGNGFPRKGLDLLLGAFPQVLQRQPQARLLVVGHDSGQATYEARARELGIAGAVRFLGGRDDAEACFGAGDVYVLPTRYDPFANATIEALASGLPVITTDSNGGSELIEPGVQGSVLSITDGIEGLSRSMLDWCDPARITQAAQAARNLAEQHGIESKMQATERLLEVLSKDKPHAA